VKKALGGARSPQPTAISQEAEESRGKDGRKALRERAGDQASDDPSPSAQANRGKAGKPQDGNLRPVTYTHRGRRGRRQWRLLAAHYRSGTRRALPNRQGLPRPKASAAAATPKNRATATACDGRHAAQRAWCSQAALPTAAA
jgi:hypothetical protein